MITFFNIILSYNYSFSNEPFLFFSLKNKESKLEICSVVNPIKIFFCKSKCLRLLAFWSLLIITEQGFCLPSWIRASITSLHCIGTGNEEKVDALFGIMPFLFSGIKVLMHSFWEALQVNTRWECFIDKQVHSHLSLWNLLNLVTPFYVTWRGKDDLLPPSNPLLSVIFSYLKLRGIERCLVLIGSKFADLPVLVFIDLINWSGIYRP